MEMNKEEYTKAEVKGGVEMSLYEINQNIISQFSPVDEETLERIKQEIKDFYAKTDSIFYMLLCNELHSYTILKKRSLYTFADFETFEDGVLSLIDEGGFQILAGDKFEDRYEIWLKKPDEEEAHVFILFPYDQGVVTYG